MGLKVPFPLLLDPHLLLSRPPLPPAIHLAVFNPYSSITRSTASIPVLHENEPQKDLDLIITNCNHLALLPLLEWYWRGGP